MARDGWQYDYGMMPSIFFKPATDWARDLEESKQLYTREYTKYKDMIAAFKHMLSIYCSEPDCISPMILTELQNFLLAIYTQAEEVACRKRDILFWKVRKGWGTKDQEKE